MTFPPQLPADKASHFVYGAAIFVVTFYAQVAFAILTHAHPDLDYVISMWVNSLYCVAVFAIGKEIVDWILNKLAIRSGKPPVHGVEPLDALATIGGGVCASAPVAALLALTLYTLD